MIVTLWWPAGLVLLVLVVGLVSGLRVGSHLPSVMLIEPLLLMVRRWQIARLTGDGNKVEVALGWLESTHVGDGLLEQILPTPKKRNRDGVTLISSRQLPLLGEQRLVRQGKQTFSVIVGTAGDVLPELILTKAERAKLQQETDQAAEHGFLTLLVGQTAVHSTSSDAPTRLEHVFLGSVLLEPLLDTVTIEKIGRLPNVEKRLLTVLPKIFASYLAEKIGVTGQADALTGQESPEVFEKQVHAAAVLAEADHQRRYQIIRALQLTHHCSLLSKLPSDDGLPISRRHI